VAFVAGLVLLILFVRNYPLSRAMLGRNNFLQFYEGAKLVGTGKLHPGEAIEKI